VKVFLDTSVLVPALVTAHERHSRAYSVLNKVQNGEDAGVISAHTLAELYAVLTRLPLSGRHSSEEALISLEENVIKHFEISSLTASDYRTLIREAAMAGIQGGTIYDAVLLRSAMKARVEKIFTFNVKHFTAIAPPDMVGILVEP
jgi:predicted nucleic acid-binding protein